MKCSARLGFTLPFWGGRRGRAQTGCETTILPVTIVICVSGAKLRYWVWYAILRKLGSGRIRPVPHRNRVRVPPDIIPTFRDSSTNVYFGRMIHILRPSDRIRRDCQIHYHDVRVGVTSDATFLCFAAVCTILRHDTRFDDVDAGSA